jgi:peptidoglycan/xylan/chitin deacetylase (PgdA/CDA1 family)
MRATFAVPAVIAHVHCDLVRSLAAEGHEIAAQGFRHEDVSGLDRDEEWLRMARTTEILADVAGRKPAGWFSLPRQGDRYAVGAISPNTRQRTGRRHPALLGQRPREPPRAADTCPITTTSTTSSS